MPLLRVALTGGIATGKSYCLDRFARLGAKTIDADALARDAVAVGSPGLVAVVQRFGRGVLHPRGDLDRTALGRLVFDNPAARRDLEAIVHPVVYGAISNWLETLRAEAPEDGPKIVAIADIPLLFETGRHQAFDVIVVAACPPDRQLERLTARGLTREDAERRIAAQLHIDKKIQRADYVIDTSGSFPETDAQVDRVWAALSELDARRP
ncbi:MAG TPA: dephospho-CoA kinase [Vicinamibacterales bacterium]|nr:dephospho-CoA kinase [Vicinamibacterales bacterium]